MYYFTADCLPQSLIYKQVGELKIAQVNNNENNERSRQINFFNFLLL